MRVERQRVSAVTVLAGLVLLLVPALAWLQYRWVGQLSQAERERMQRTLRTAASQFAVEFDTELSRALTGLQVEGSMLRDHDWGGYAERYSSWTEGAATPKLVREVLLVDAGARVDVRLPAFSDSNAPPSGGLPDTPPVSAERFTLLRWNAAAMAFEPVEWPADLAARRAAMAEYLQELATDRARGGGERDRSRRNGGLSQWLGDDQTLVAPVTLVEPMRDHQGPPRIAILGFTLVRIDPGVVRDTLLASLASRHLHGEDGASDYRVAVVRRTDPGIVIWESEPGAARVIGDAPDVSQEFMAARPERMFVFARHAASPGTAEPAAFPRERIVVSVQERRGATDDPAANRARVFAGGDGRWRLIAKHRAGSLEAAVAAVRARNLLLSSGILLLLTTAVGLIVVSSRRAEQLARQQLEFVATVSHELRTPVSVIGVAAGNLADGVVGDPARVRKYGETIQGEARRLGETVERVLQLAGIASGRAAAVPSRAHPADLIQASIGACRAELDASGCAVEVDVAPGLPMVLGDMAALRSVLQNLISNAVKYGGQARWVRVAAASGPASTGPKATVVFTVADRGLGIDANDRKRVFEPFFRGREAVARQIQGSGLGLTLVERIVRAHGGRVSATSEPGKGSTFTVTLPADPGVDAPVATPGEAPVAPPMPAGRS